MHIRTTSLSVAVFAILAVGCSSDAEPASEPEPPSETTSETIAAPAASEPATAAGDSPTISIEGFAFSSLDPVAPGTEIAVTNLDGTQHTLTADDGSFHTGGVDGGTTTSIIAPDADGIYTFVCNIHPTMSGSLTVQS